MNKLEKEIHDVIQSIPLINDADGNLSDDYESYAKATAAVAIRWMCDFKEWYDKLSPAGKCTVWPPAGSGSGPGLYNMETKDIVEKFINKK